MSTAAKVPETWELSGDDARETLRTVGIGQLLRDSWQRLRFADGFSHARSLAFTISLVLVQAIIALVGFASIVGKGGLSDIIVRSIQAAVPGPAGRTLTSAVAQANKAGGSDEYLGLVFGLVGALITGSTLMGQVERALNRLYGVEQDRPTVRKYGLALLLAISAGLLAMIAWASLAFGRSVGRSLPDSTASVWNAVRWPLGLVLMMSAIALLFRCSPRRHQPRWSWLALGASISVLLWSAVTIALGAFFHSSSSFGDTYGPLAGIVALLLWSLLSSIAFLYGAAVAAQLEAVRAGAPAPQDRAKLTRSEPESAELAHAGRR
jgi:YihY family inner membrane protein